MATPAERAAIDAVLSLSHPAHGTVSGTGSGTAPGTALGTAPGTPAPGTPAPSTQHPAPGTRHLLLPALHAAQGRAGWISEGALNYICEQLSVPPAEAFGVASFYALFSLQPRPPVVHVCDDIAGRANGAEGICQDLGQHVGAKGESLMNAGAMWLLSPCLGQCDRAPAALAQRAGSDPRDWTMTSVTADDIVAILRNETSRVVSDELGAPQPRSGEGGPVRRSCEAAKAEPRSTRIHPACCVASASWIRRVSMRIGPTAAMRR